MESVKLPSVNYLGEKQMITTKSFSGHASRADLQRRCQDKTGLDGITLNIAARTKWVYTKPVTAAVSTQVKTMSHLHTSNPQGIRTNMINISNWQCADNAVKDNLTLEKELETFGAVARRYRNNLLTDTPTGTDSIHFCCGRYNTLSLKS